MIGLDDAVRLIKAGRVIAFPTETAYGLGADAKNPDAVAEVFRIKDRPLDKAVPIIVDSIESLEGLGETNELGKYLSRHLHPGPLNITLKDAPKGLGAFRISSCDLANKLAKNCGPVTATSANQAGEEPAYSAEDAAKMDLPVLDGGKLEIQPVSTVYDTENRRVMRQGSISIQDIEAYIHAFDVLNRVKPGPEEASKVLERANEALRLVQEEHEDALLGGSLAKGTFNRKVNDADIFLLFPPGEDLDGKLPLLEKIGKRLGEVEISYAQHPYVKADFKGLEVELVPAYKTKPTDIISAADRSPWHVDYVREKPEWLKDEVRIFKQFCEGVGVYGAGSAVEGLSAYAMEVLVLKNQGFVKALWDIKERDWPVDEEDPVDPERNVLASVTQKQFKKLKRAATDYLKKPNHKFFFPNEPNKVSKIQGIALVEFPMPELVEDSSWGFIKGKARKIARNGPRWGYHVVKWSVHVGKRALAAFEVDCLERPKRVLEGPAISRKEAVKNFRDAHPNCFERDGKLYAEVDNKFKNFEEFVRGLEEGNVLTDAKIELDKLSQDELTWLRHFLDPRDSWEY